MMNQDKNFLSKLKHNSLRGGMLMELMLSVALAAIAIPFVVRYQKNTIERARNVAVVKQMDIVRRALERCIFEKQSELLRPVNDVVFTEDTDHKKIDCLILSSEDGQYGLINYGLTPEFAADYANDYKLRIRKSRDNNNEAVLQGVVLLTNGNVNSMRTREIVNLGGGKVGFVDGNFIRGGFNAFHTEKTNFDLSGYASGLVETTNTTRGDSKYLWRLNAANPEDNNPEDSTMLSFLNLDGHDIVNVGALGSQTNKIMSAYFANGLSIEKGDVNIKNLNFMRFVNLGGAYETNLAIVNGNLSSNTKNSVLTVQDTFTINPVSDASVANIENFNVNITDSPEGNKKLVMQDLNLNKCITLDDVNKTQVCLTDVTINTNKCAVYNKSNVKALKSISLDLNESDSDKNPVITPKLHVGNVFAKNFEHSEKFYIRQKEKLEISLNDIKLTKCLDSHLDHCGLNGALKHVVNQEESFIARICSGCASADSVYGFFSDDFCHDCFKPAVPVSEIPNSASLYLKKIDRIHALVMAKYECVNKNNIDNSTFIDKCMQCVTDCAKNTEYSGVQITSCFNKCLGN